MFGNSIVVKATGSPDKKAIIVLNGNVINRSKFLLCLTVILSSKLLLKLGRYRWKTMNGPLKSCCPLKGCVYNTISVLVLNNTMAISAVCKPAKLLLADVDRVHDEDVWPYNLVSFIFSIQVVLLQHC